MTSRILIVYAYSPLHAGTGQSTAAVDLPIARDRATSLPLLPGSSIKGALRARARSGAQTLSEHWQATFGPETDNASDFGGAVSFSDARLLMLPVRSVAGTFAWVTSPLLLSTLRRDVALCGLTLPAVPAPLFDQAMITTTSTLKLTVGGARTPKVLLEEFDLTPQSGTAHDALARGLAGLIFPDDAEWRGLMEQRLCVVHDDVMAFFATHGTDLVTRVSIDPETGTAKDHQLWTEENLPAESVLAGLVEELPTTRVQACHQGQHLSRIEDDLLTTPIQLGGKASIGRGRCKLSMHGGR